MKNIIVSVKNVSKLAAQGRALMNRPVRLNHGLGLIYGDTGLGKTTATAWFAVKNNAYYIRSMAAWRTPSSLLRAICKEIDVFPKRYVGDMLEVITNKLSLANRPLFLDEANYLMRFPELRDTIMDLHDMSTIPIILVGMTGIEKQIKESEKFENRILIDVKFEALDLDDARKVANQLCEVAVADDLLADLHKYSKGNTRRIATGLYRIEQIASQLQVDAMNLAQFRQSKGTYFLGVSA